MTEQFQIGWYNLEEDTVFTETFSYAAWYKKILVKAGKYPIMARQYTYNERLRKMTNEIKDHGSIWISLEGDVVADDFSSHYGGVRVGSKIDQYVGQRETYVMTPYAHTVARSILEKGEDSPFSMIEPFKAEWVHFTSYSGEKLTTTKLINTEMESVDR